MGIALDLNVRIEMYLNKFESLSLPLKAEWYKQSDYTAVRLAV